MVGAGTNVGLLGQLVTSNEHLVDSLDEVLKQVDAATWVLQDMESEVLASSSDAPSGYVSTATVLEHVGRLKDALGVGGPLKVEVD